MKLQLIFQPTPKEPPTNPTRTASRTASGMAWYAWAGCGTRARKECYFLAQKPGFFSVKNGGENTVFLLANAENSRFEAKRVGAWVAVSSGSKCLNFRGV